MEIVIAVSAFIALGIAAISLIPAVRADLRR